MSLLELSHFLEYIKGDRLESANIDASAFHVCNPKGGDEIVYNFPLFFQYLLPVITAILSKNRLSTSRPGLCILKDLDVSSFLCSRFRICQI